VKRAHVLIELIAVLDWDVNVEADLGGGCDTIGEDCFLAAKRVGVRAPRLRSARRRTMDFDFRFIVMTSELN